MSAAVLQRTSAASNGGALYAAADTSVEISVFNGTSAALTGGAVACSGALRVSGSSFEAGFASLQARPNQEAPRPNHHLLPHSEPVSPARHSPAEMLTTYLLILMTQEGFLTSIGGLSVAGSIFRGGLSATAEGGALFSTEPISVASCAFASCEAQTSGGAIAGRSDVMVSSSSFDSCVAKSASGGAVSAPAVRASGYALTVSGSEFTDCSAPASVRTRRHPPPAVRQPEATCCSFCC